MRRPFRRIRNRRIFWIAVTAYVAFEIVGSAAIIHWGLL